MGVCVIFFLPVSCLTVQYIFTGEAEESDDGIFSSIKYFFLKIWYYSSRSLQNATLNYILPAFVDGGDFDYTSVYFIAAAVLLIMVILLVAPVCLCIKCGAFVVGFPSLEAFFMAQEAFVL